MSTAPKYCSNCGEKLDENLEVKECPKCHSALHEHSSHVESTSRVVEQLPYKSPGTAALIAFIGGIFALPGIGHIYVGKVGKGIGILISGIILVTLSAVSTYSVISFVQVTSADSTSRFLDAVVVSAIFGIAYLVLFIWQIFNARKLAKKFNETVKRTGKEPW